MDVSISLWATGSAGIAPHSGQSNRGVEEGEEMQGGLTRRKVLSGRVASTANPSPSTSPDHVAGVWHISSAVVSIRPEDRAAMAERLSRMPGVEVNQSAGCKIVILIEGPDSGTLGARLAEIALMDRVLSANMVYETIDTDAQDTVTNRGDA